MSTLAPISIPVGYDFSEELTIDDDGVGVDLTGCTVTLHLYALGSSTLAITPAPTLALTDEENGVVTLTLTDTQTATLTPATTYRYGVKVTDGTGIITPPVYGLAYAAAIPGGA